MTIQDMHYDFKFKFNKLDSEGQRELSVPEIDWILNEAMLMFIKQRFGQNNTTRSGFETTEKRIQDLKELVVKPPISTPLTPQPVPDFPGVYQVNLNDLPSKLLFLIRSYSNISKGKCVDTANNHLVQHDDLNDILTHPYYSPSFEWREIPVTIGGEDNKMYLYTNNEFDINSVNIEYIKYPKRLAAPSLFLPTGGYYLPDGTTFIGLNQNCELSDHTHSEIVDIAVTNAYLYTQNPAIQWGQNKLQINE